MTSKKFLLRQIILIVVLDVLRKLSLNKIAQKLFESRRCNPSIGTPTSSASFDQNDNFKFLQNPDLKEADSEYSEGQRVIFSYFRLAMATLVRSERIHLCRSFFFDYLQGPKLIISNFVEKIIPQSIALLSGPVDIQGSHQLYFSEVQLTKEN